MNKNKAKGTRAERLYVEYLRRCGWVNAERRALGGTNDRGDIAGIPGVVIEVKNTNSHDLAQFIHELITEMENDNSQIGWAIIKKRGTEDPAKWYALTTGEIIGQLAKEAGY